MTVTRRRWGCLENVRVIGERVHDSETLRSQFILEEWVLDKYEKNLT